MESEVRVALEEDMPGHVKLGQALRKRALDAVLHWYIETRHYVRPGLQNGCWNVGIRMNLLER